MEESQDKYRWYLCVQNKIEKWDCVRTSGVEALRPFFYGADHPNTKAIMINKWYPRLFDPLILNWNLHPRVGINT